MLTVTLMSADSACQAHSIIMQAKVWSLLFCNIESLETSRSSTKGLQLQSLREKAGDVRDIAVLKDVLREIGSLSAVAEARYLRRRCNITNSCVLYALSCHDG